MFSNMIQKWPIFVALFCALLGALGQLFLKLGSSNFTVSLTQIILDWKVLVGVGFYAMSSVLFIIALKYGNLSLLYPMIATSYIWVALLSKFVLHESFSIYKMIGFILILSGVTFIGAKG